MRDDHPLTGRTVDEVRRVGKHLLMQFSGDLVLRTHMRMNGSWHIYRPGETWQKPRIANARAGRDRRIRCRRLQHSRRGVPRRRLVSCSGIARCGRSGPILVERFMPRARVRPGARAAREEIGDALLNQRIMAGSATSTNLKCCTRAESIRSRGRTRLDNGPQVACSTTATGSTWLNVSPGPRR